MLSILVAFAIDAGWDEWQDRDDEAELLQALRVEYETNRDLVQEVIDAHASYIADMEITSQLAPADYDTMSVNTASRLVLSFANPSTFRPRARSHRDPVQFGTDRTDPGSRVERNA
ncbi:MAG: hypothetical protein RLN75_08755, partial [Longimicrobiales bacterium]